MSYSVHSIAFAAAFLLLSAWIGRGLMAALDLPEAGSDAPGGLIALALGMGACIVLLFVLAALGGLQALPMAAAFAAAAGLAALARRSRRERSPRPAPPLHAATWIVAALAAVTVALLALSAPLEWDALAYHLPYARAYAEAGGLTVETRLRYPLQPHNFQLLYAAALVFAQEAAAQLMHAACGALTAVGVFAYARRNHGPLAAWLAAGLFLSAAGSLLDAAYVDLGVAMFAFFAFYAFALWLPGRSQAWLLISAFLLGLALGAKYQALILLPVYALALAAARPGWRSAASAAAMVFAAGSWWYLRSAWVSGDPLHPLGGPWFGYLWWNAADLQAQYGDIAGRGLHVPWELLPALAFPFLRRFRTPAGKALSIVGLGGLAAWGLSSGLERYLLPVYAPLALMSAAVLGEAAARWLPSAAPGDVLRRAGPWLGLALLTVVMAVTVTRKWPEICFTGDCVAEVWAERMDSRAAVTSVPGFAELKLYQLGLEDEFYTLGNDVAGDWFGPWRYRDVLALQGQPQALAAHLRALGRDSLLVSRRRPPFDAFAATLEETHGLTLLYRDERVALYRLQER